MGKAFFTQRAQRLRRDFLFFFSVVPAVSVLNDLRSVDSGFRRKDGWGAAGVGALGLDL